MKILIIIGSCLLVISCYNAEDTPTMEDKDTEENPAAKDGSPEESTGLENNQEDSSPISGSNDDINTTGNKPDKENQPTEGETYDDEQPLGGSGPLNDSCIPTISTSLDWNEESPVGSPQEVFSHLEGSCKASLVWDGSKWKDVLKIEPLVGESTLTATLTIDKDSSRYLEEDTSAASGFDCIREPSIAVDAILTMETPNGTLVRDAPLLFDGTRDHAIRDIWIRLDEERLGDWISITPINSKEPINVFFRIVPFAWACKGKISIQRPTTIGKEEWSSEYGTIQLASWSDTGSQICSYDQSSIQLNEPYRGVYLIEEMEKAISKTEFTGTPFEGESTTVSFYASLKGMEACVSNDGNSVEFQAEILANTANGLIKDLSIEEGTITAHFVDDKLKDMELIYSQTYDCVTLTDELPDKTISCATVGSMHANIEVTIGIEDPSTTDGKLETQGVGFLSLRYLLTQ